MAGPVDAHTGIVMDYGDIKKLVGPLVEQLDHYCLNDVGNTLNDPLLQNPTSENLARWFYREVKELIPQLSHIVVHETCTSLCIYRGQ